MLDQIGPKARSRTVSKQQTQGQVTGAKHPVQPRARKLDIGEAHRAIASTYPKILAELAK